MSTATATATACTPHASLEDRLLFASRFVGGVEFEVSHVRDGQPIELGPVDVGTDCITAALGGGTTAVFDMQGQQVLAPIQAGSIILMTKGTHVSRTRVVAKETWINFKTDLERLRNAASFGEYGSHHQDRVFGVVDAHLARMLWLIFDEARKGYPSGVLLTEAACLSMLSRAYAIGSRQAVRKRLVPRLSRQEKVLIRDALAEDSGVLTTVSLGLELGRNPLDFERQFEATFGLSLEQHLANGRASPSEADTRRTHPSVYRADRRAPRAPVAGWFAPPIEDPRTWDLCRPVHERDGDIALVLWQEEHVARLLQSGKRHVYVARKGSIDIIGSDATFDLQGDDNPLPALVIPIERARLSAMGLTLGASRKRAHLQIEDARLAGVAQQLIAQWNAPRLPGATDVRQMAELLIGYLGNLARFDVVDAEETGLDFRERERIWTHIAQHLGRGSDASALLQITGYSRQSFSSLFKASFGTTAHQFVLDRMIDMARFLLRRTDLPLTQVAMECGFASHAHLTTTFSTRVGCRPSTYRGRSIPGLNRSARPNVPAAHACG